MTQDKYKTKAQLIKELGELRQRVSELEITEAERKRTEESLTQTNETLLALINHSPLAIILMDLDSNVLLWNKAAEKIYGWTAEEVLGEFLPNVSNEKLEEHLALRQRVTKGESITNIELERRRKDGSTFFLDVSIAPLRNAQGKIYAQMSIGADITERKKTEEALRLTQLTVDWARDAIHWVGRDGEFLYVNKAICQALGYTREELLSMTIFDIDPLFSKGEHLERWEQTRNVGYYLFETIHKTKDGRLIPVEIAVDRVNYAGQEFNCAYARDITERKRSEQIIQLRLSLMEFAATYSLEELLRKTLDEVGELTDSPIGFYHFVDADQKTLSLQAWSTRTLAEFCQAKGEGLHYPIDEAGVWVDCVRERRPVIHNDYQSLPHRQGLPEGHAQIIRELVVPVLRDDRIVAILGVGNKPQDYTETDVKVVSYVADLTWEIIERKRTDDALKQNQALLDESQRITHIGSWDMDLKTHQIIWTDETFRIFGYRPQEFQPTFELFINCIHPDDQSMIQEHHRELLTTKKFRDFDYRVLRPDGTVRWIHAMAEVYIDDAGVPVRAIGTIQDITERRQAEEALHLTRFTIDNVTDAVYWIEPEAARFVDVNEAACRMLGYTHEELLNMSVTDIDPKFSLAEWPELWKYIKEKGKLTREVEHKTKDGRLIPVEIIANFIQFGDRELDCAIVRNVTKRKQMDEALRQSEERLQQAVRVSHIGMFDHDHLTDTIYWSPEQRQNYGWGPEETVTLSKFLEQIYIEDRERIEEAVRRAHDPAGDGLFDVEHRIVRRDGAIRWVSTQSQTFFKGEGSARRPVRTIGATLDITEFREVENQLKASLQEKEVLLQEIHHRVKNNMQIISSLLDLQADNIRDEAVCEIFQESRQRIKSMALIHERLYQSKDLARIDFAEYGESLTNHLLHSYGTRAGNIKLHLAIEPISLSIETAIPCGLIINELVSNAFKHAFPDGKAGQIWVELRTTENQQLSLIIKDDGVGFPKDIDFHHTTSLGLILVNTLSKQINGALELNKSNGTEFKITFSTR